MLGTGHSHLRSQDSKTDVPWELTGKSAPWISLKVASSLNSHCKDSFIHHLDSSIFKYVPSGGLSRSAADCSHPGSQGTRVISICSGPMPTQDPSERCRPGRWRNTNSYSKKQWNESHLPNAARPYFLWLMFAQDSVKGPGNARFYWSTAPIPTSES